MAEIILNVEFEKDNAADWLSNEVQVVPSDISWEDFELMVCPFVDVFFLLRNQGRLLMIWCDTVILTFPPPHPAKMGDII